MEAETPCKNQNILLESLCGWAPGVCKDGGEGIKFDFNCPVRGEEPESLIHALVSCDFAFSVWSLWQDCPLNFLLNAKDFTGLVHQICSNSGGVPLEYFFAIS